MSSNSERIFNIVKGSQNRHPENAAWTINLFKTLGRIYEVQGKPVKPSVEEINKALEKEENGARYKDLLAVFLGEENAPLFNLEDVLDAVERVAALEKK